MWQVITEAQRIYQDGENELSHSEAISRARKEHDPVKGRNGISSKNPLILMFTLRGKIPWLAASFAVGSAVPVLWAIQVAFPVAA